MLKLSENQRIFFSFYSGGEMAVLLIVNSVLKALLQYFFSSKMVNIILGLMYSGTISKCE